MKKLLIMAVFSAVFLLMPSLSRAQKKGQVTESEFVSQCVTEMDPHGNSNPAGNAILACTGEYWVAVAEGEVDNVFDDMMFGWVPTIDYFHAGTEEEYDPYIEYVSPLLGGGNEGDSPD